MELITLTHENLEAEHICCAIASEKDCQVLSKKAWLKGRLDEGLVFTKGNVRGKCFIEYIPAENAWAPVDAPGYLYINCLWVSGQYKGQGYSNLLLESCIADAKAKGKRGLVILSSKKKLGFLADPKYLPHKGFRLANTAAPYFELMALPFGDAIPLPQFKPHIKEPVKGVPAKGFTVYYANQCPFTAKYVPLLEAVAQAKGAAFQSIHLQTAEQAHNAPSPFTTFGLFYQGEFVTHEILSEKKFEKLIGQPAV